MQHLAISTDKHYLRQTNITKNTLLVLII